MNYIRDYIFLILIILAISLVFLLALYAIWVRIKQATYTEKRFNFVALWSCTTLLVSVVAITSKSSILYAITNALGLTSLDLQPSDKIVIWIGTLAYVWIISRWACHWNGLVTIHGVHFSGNYPTFYFVQDGIRETLRIAARRPPAMAHVIPKISRTVELPPPITALPVHEQVRELAIARWPEFIIADDAWIAEAGCWRGVDTALNRSVLLVSAVDLSEVNWERLKRQVSHEKSVFLIFVLDRVSQVDNQSLRELAVETVIQSFEEFVISALPIRRYAQEIEKEYSDHKIANSTFTLRDTYVSTRIYHLQLKKGRLAKDNNAVDFQSVVSSWLSEKSGRQIALLGDYGQGKSSEALALTNRLLTEQAIFESRSYRLPILVRLTGVSPKSTSPEELLGAWGARYGINGRALLALHRAGRTLLIFDAFDEMASVSDHADRIDHFAALWRFSCPNSKIIFTGRPNFFLDDIELQQALGISQNVSVGPYCSAVRVAEFDSEQIAGALRWLPTEKIKVFMNATAKSEQLAELARRPSLLFQLAQLWDKGRLQLEDRHLRSATVIRSFITYSLERQVDKQRSDISAFGDKHFILLRRSELDYFTSACAVSALTEGRSNSLTDHIMRRTIDYLLQSFPETSMERMNSETGALALSLLERLQDKPDAVEACVQAVRTHGVIEHDPSKAGQYKFSHKSFAEVLGAEVLTRAVREQVPTPLSPFVESVRRELISQDVVFRFAADLAFGYEGTRVPPGPSVLKLFYSRSFGPAMKAWYWSQVVLAFILDAFSSTAMLAVTLFIKRNLVVLKKEPSGELKSHEKFFVRFPRAALYVDDVRFETIFTIRRMMEKQVRTMRAAAIGLATFSFLSGSIAAFLGSTGTLEVFKIIAASIGVLALITVWIMSASMRGGSLFSDPFLFAFLFDRINLSQEKYASPEIAFSGHGTLDRIVLTKLLSHKAIGDVWLAS